MPKKTKFYAVARGRRCGIFLSWPECQQQVTGYGGAIFKSFKSREEAEAFLREKQDQGAPTGKKRSAEEDLATEGQKSDSDPVLLAKEKDDTESVGQSNRVDALVASRSKKAKVTEAVPSSDESHVQLAQSAASTKCYAVAVGRRAGIYKTWQETQSQTAGFSGAVYRSFPSEEQARNFLDQRGVDWQSGNRKEIKAPWHIPPENAKATATVEVPPGDQGDAVNANEAGLHITMNFDGGARGNPGLAGAGAVVVSKYVEGSSSEASTGSSSRDITICKIREFCGYHATNNVAEYTGLLVGLRRIKEVVQQYVNRVRGRKFDGRHSNHSGAKSLTMESEGRAAFSPSAAGGSKSNISSAKVTIVVRGDSNLIIEQINGTNEVRSANLKGLYERCKSLIQDLRVLGKDVTISVSHVFRESNVVADGLANEAMDTRKSWISTEQGT